MSEAKHAPVQFGTADSADFEAMTWAFQMPKGYRVFAGEVAIVPRGTYDDMLAALQRSKKWIEDAMTERGWPRERAENPPEGSHLHAINAAIAKALGR